MRIPFGLDRLPRTTDADDPRLPGVVVGAEMLRLNSEPVPADVMSVAIGDHAARVDAMARWLNGSCGDYSPQRQRFIGAYFRDLAAHLQQHEDELAAGLKRYDGLYAPHDWLWSALRPLPRAWLPSDGRLLSCDMAFWDSDHAIAVELAGQETDRTAALRAAGIETVRLGPDALGGNLLDVLPQTFKYFWRDQVLPASPFRRAIPQGVLA
ncbi:MAG TPA: hypothetical protein VGG99_04130 [Acetobacteraceae bacterium]